MAFYESVLVITDTDIQSFTLESVDLDASGVAANLNPDTEYVHLTSAETEEYAAGKIEFQQDGGDAVVINFPNLNTVKTSVTIARLRAASR